MQPVEMHVRKDDLEILLHRLEAMVEPSVRYQDDKEAMQRDVIKFLTIEADHARLFVRSLLRM